MPVAIGTLMYRGAGFDQLWMVSKLDYIEKVITITCVYDKGSKVLGTKVVGHSSPTRLEDFEARILNNTAVWKVLSY